MIAITGFILLFTLLGIIFSTGKGAGLIAGYNTMTGGEKEKYDKVALCKFTGKIMFTVSFCMLFCLLSIIFSIIWLSMVGTILLIGIVLFAVTYANNGERFKKKT